MGWRPLINYTLQDVVGSLLAFVLSSLVFVFPGYVIGQALNLLDFRARRRIVRYVFALVFSNAIVPILSFLAYRLSSARAGLILFIVFAGAWALIEVRALLRDRSAPKSEPTPGLQRYERIALAIAAGWVIFSILILVDLQIGQRLYFNLNSYDFTTRASMVDAITRTGLPPVNAGYYDGGPSYASQLHYFWYIPASAVDALGRSLVSAREAMIASVAWCGLVLMATLATYVRLRNPGGGLAAWRRSLGGLLLLLVAGLDIFLVVPLLIVYRLGWGALPFGGLLEGWNAPIVTWAHTLIMAPHQVASALACIAGLLVMLASLQRSRREKIIAAVFAGLAFASSAGLSTWVTFAFAAFWLVWMVALLVSRSQRWQVGWLALTGLVALVVDLPYLAALVQPSAGSGTAPLTFAVHSFSLVWYIAALFDLGPSSPLITLLNLVFLPLNYLLELGFLLLVAGLWLARWRRGNLPQSPFHLAEVTLVGSSFVVLSILRSSVIRFDDLGTHGWLPAQFVLVVWALDLLSEPLARGAALRPATIRAAFSPPRTGSLIALTFVAGMLFTGLEVASDRLWAPLVDVGAVGFPNYLSPDRQLGARTYAARLAYDFIAKHVPAAIMIQNNPRVVVDRAGGLYGDHQMVVAGRAAYGVPTEDFQRLSASVEPIFVTGHSSWDAIDRICAQHGIGGLVINDLDPIWKSLPDLSRERPPLYSNDYYAVYACGDYARQAAQ